MVRPRDICGTVSILTTGVAEVDGFVRDRRAIVRCRLVMYYRRVRTDATNGVEGVALVEGAAHHPSSSNNFVACLALVHPSQLCFKPAVEARERGAVPDATCVEIKQCVRLLRETSTPSSRRGHGDNVASMA